MDRIMLGVYAVGAVLGGIGTIIGSGMLWGAIQNVKESND